MKHGNICHSRQVHPCGGMETRHVLETKQTGIRKDLRQDMLMKKHGKTGKKVEMNGTC